MSPRSRTLSTSARSGTRSRTSTARNRLDNRCPIPAPWPPAAGHLYYYYAWRDEGVFKQLNADLTALARQHAGREAEPTAAIIDTARGPGDVAYSSVANSLLFGWPVATVWSMEGP